MASVDASGLIRSIRAVRESGKKIAPDWLNNTAKSVAIKAIMFTPKTPAAQIRAELTDGVCRAILKRGTNLPKRLSWWRPNATHTREEWARAIKQLRAARASSSGSRKAGWVKVAQTLGGRQGSRVSKAGNPGKSYSDKANESNLATLIVSRAGGAETGAAALQQAVAAVAKDKNDYAIRRMEKICRQNSAR